MAADLVGGLGPAERVGAVVPSVDVSADRGFEVFDVSSSPTRNTNGSTRDMTHDLNHRPESHFQHATLDPGPGCSRLQPVHTANRCAMSRRTPNTSLRQAEVNEGKHHEV